jgi:hypothetical protein
MSVREALLKEIDSLPENKQADVLAYVRFLKLGLGEPEQVRKRFQEALVEIRKEAAGRHLSEAEIEAEIRAVRAGK